MRSVASIYSVAMRQRLVCMALLLAVLASQSLGLLHRYVHLPGGSHHSKTDAQQTSTELRLKAADALSPLPQISPWVAGLFSVHTEGSAACLGFDTCFDSVPSPALPAVVAVPAIGFLLHLNGLAIARWHAQFQARGPPLFH